MPATTALCPGTFDPPTLGHIDVIRRAAHLFERVIVGVAVAPEGKKPLLSDAERVDLMRQCLADTPNVEVRSFGSLVVDFAHEVAATVLVKGLRTEADVLRERKMSELNRDLAPEIETVFLAGAPQYGHISSSAVREILAYGGDISRFVPEPVVRGLAGRTLPRR